MKIVIETNGMNVDTKISLNGKPIEGLKEFHFSMNPHRIRGGQRTIEGKCKMSMGFDGDYRSYFADDFRKFGEYLGSDGTAVKK